jgi:heme exporter protein B
MPSADRPAVRWLRATVAVFLKDWRSEMRTRYAISALGMFVVTTIAMILFSLAGEVPSLEVLAGVLWVVIFFAAMSGLSRTFVMEEERGTSMTVQLQAPASAVYFGKLLFNLLLGAGLTLLTVMLYALFIAGFVVQSYGIFAAGIALGSIGLSAASTIIAAIIARANTKGTLYPVLSFPILLPVLMTAIRTTRMSCEGATWADAGGEFQVLISYIVVVITASYMLFDYIWKD